ncbi:MAG: hypothetical protein WAK20_01655 [Candidatus Acidiferrum sp.]
MDYGKTRVHSFIVPSNRDISTRGDSGAISQELDKMPELSPRTLGKVIRVLEQMPGAAWSEKSTHILQQDYWQGKLFEEALPGWFREVAPSYNYNWSIIVPLLFEGHLKTVDDASVGDVLCHVALRRLVVMVLVEKGIPDVEAVRMSVQADGFTGAQKELVPIDGPVSVEQEKSRLLADLKVSKLGNKEVIAVHVKDAVEHFANGKHHSAIGEARTALESAIDETVILLELRHSKKSGCGTGNKIPFMEETRFLSSDEKSAFLAAWGFLCSGNHPGISTEEQGRIGVILSLEFLQILIIKGKTLL